MLFRNKLFTDFICNVTGNFYKSVHTLFRRGLHVSTQTKKLRVLGIETSCDDTGASVVDSDGQILGEALHSQTKLSVQLGGVVPAYAETLHNQHIERVVFEALEEAKLKLQDVDAIATTVKPGTPICLKVGFNFTKHLLSQVNKPFIPIHHMEAHALTARMIKRIDFPFLVLLVSGGHCILSVVRDVSDFIVLGNCHDTAPGECFDKMARRMKCKNLAEFSEISGGRAIEILAKTGNPKAFNVVSVMTQIQDCNFSFSGIKHYFGTIIEAEEERQDIRGGNTLPNLPDVCASLQYCIAKHMTTRLQRAFMYCDYADLLSDKRKTLVVSGGVASNQFIRDCLQKVCVANNCDLVCPPPKLCTDNGIMVAWNGIEKLRKGIGVAENIDEIKIERRYPLGEDWSSKVADAHIKVKKIDILKRYHAQDSKISLE